MSGHVTDSVTGGPTHLALRAPSNLVIPGRGSVLWNWGAAPGSSSETGMLPSRETDYLRGMEPPPFVPAEFDPPTSLVTDEFSLEPLGEQHNEADHAAWTSSIAHIRSTPGYPDGSWPPLQGMSLESNARDLRRHDADFALRRGFTFTVLDPEDGDVIGCVYLYPPEREGADVTVQSWVRADRGDLDVPLADAVAAWLETDWPWDRPGRFGR